MGHKMGHKRTRGKGEGSIYRRSDGYWVGAVEAGRGPDGQRRKARVVRKRRADVLAALDELRRTARKEGIAPDRSTTVSAYMTWWLNEVAAVTVSETSLREYRTRVMRIDAGLGRYRLGKLTTAHVQQFANQLARDYPRTPRTRAQTLGMLRQALRWAVGAGMLGRNPAEHVSAPRTIIAKTDDTLEADEAKAVLAAAQGDELHALWWLALSYGLRIGELMALRWPDVDLDGGEVTVRRAGTKTDAGHRTLPLIDAAAAVLAAHRATAGGDGYVFARPDGQPLYHQLVHRRWTDLLTRAGIAHLCRNCGSDDECSTSVRRFHVSRHTAATLLLERGVPLEVVSAILGHANIGITAGIYAKVRSDLKRRGLSSLTDDAPAI